MLQAVGSAVGRQSGGGSSQDVRKLQAEAKAKANEAEAKAMEAKAVHARVGELQAQLTNGTITPEGRKELELQEVRSAFQLSQSRLGLAVAEATGFKGEIHWDTSKPDGTPKKQLDVSRLSALGWQSRIQLSDGLHTTVLDYCQSSKIDQLRH